MKSPRVAKKSRSSVKTGLFQNLVVETVPSVWKYASVGEHFDHQLGSREALATEDPSLNPVNDVIDPHPDLSKSCFPFFNC